MNYHLIKEDMRAGRLPVLTGCHFSKQQIEEIKQILEIQKAKGSMHQIDDYFRCEVLSRLDRTKVRPTIVEIRAAKELAEAEINDILAKFLEYSELTDISLATEVVKFEEGESQLSLNIKVKIKVQI